MEEIKLHLGCGEKYIENFIHVDLVDGSHIDHCSNVDNLFMFEDNSVDLIYNCHVLEHFERNKYKNSLKEWFRVLKPNGTLRTLVPDYEKLHELYALEKNISRIEGVLMGGQINMYDYHYTVFDYNKLERSLKEIGFKDIKRYD
jgi:predicted SAM-dependent methyltransferase